MPGNGGGVVVGRDGVCGIHGVGASILGASDTALCTEPGIGGGATPAAGIPGAAAVVPATEPD